ncbi:MAG TPA: hypothetical protein VGI92_01735 [Gemmatimonadales bacterium]|jgi:hypothetical protein
MRAACLTILVSSLVAAAPASAQSFGDTTRFGAHIMHLREQGRTLRLELSSPAYGALFRLVDGEPARLVDTRDYAAGTAILRVPMVLLEGQTEHRYTPGGITRTGADAGSEGTRDARAAATCMKTSEVPATTDARPGQSQTPAPVCATSGPAMHSHSTTVQSTPEYQRDRLLLVLSDHPIDGAALAHRLGQAPFASANAAMRELPALVSGDSSTAWAAYLVRR